MTEDMEQCLSCGSFGVVMVGETVVCTTCGHGRDQLPYRRRRASVAVTPRPSLQARTAVAVVDRETRIVSYLMYGSFRATRHVTGCAVLARAEREQAEFEANPYRRFSVLRILEEEQYASLPGARPPRDHACMSPA